ncbi:OadG family protein [Vibrio sp. Hal054]|uniref:OadG family protein n=1 Tax=Vibrio sp. Hal054 TaxID=3035158 RepID=UPI00301D6599
MMCFTKSIPLISLDYLDFQYPKVRKMNEGPIILEGVNLMLLGMGFVFCFLALLVAATRLLSTLSIKFSPPRKPLALRNKRFLQGRRTTIW